MLGSSRSWQIAVALLLLLTSIALFLTDAIVCPLLGIACDLKRPAWAMFAVAVAFFFNIPLTSLIRLLMRLIEQEEEQRK